jgi:hypothetical protein
MVGWKYVAFNGTNQGNMYGEGLTVKQLMVATTPTRLQPSTLAQFQAAGGDTGALQTSTSSTSSSGSSTASTTSASSSASKATSTTIASSSTGSG